MSRWFFEFSGSQIKKTIGQIENLGLHCPACHSYVGNKSKCSKCSKERDYYRWDQEPIFDVNTPAGGFYFRKLFVPVMSPSDFKSQLESSEQFLDDRGKVYNRSEFKTYLKECEIPEIYKEAFNESLDLSSNSDISPYSDSGESNSPGNTDLN